ncbi:MAG: biotin--[acetyl-CoA-carboxylase] ligase [Bacteroidales bacterium]|jgi:BirA family biotin operon repressor/biotin-[acetyl-CoA-carboxylase] ligase|nr:biotin--[acetyl-CoA-carboxylase] ligase [Bacteroidales bacterium]
MIIGSYVRHYEKVSSTNLIASAMIRDEKPTEGTVITASFQESGRGQTGNIWESESGKNLLMSVILFPFMIKPEEQFVISQMVSLAVHDLVSMYTEEARIKWPNDIYVGDDKIAGILIENSIMGETLGSSVAGIGLNVNQTLFRSNAPNPVSLAAITGTTHDLREITGELIRLLDHRYGMMLNGKKTFPVGEYQAALYRSGEWHHYVDATGQFEGRIESVRSDGMLVVSRKNGIIREYAFKEIDYIL